MAAWAHLSISRCIINGTVSSVMTGIVPTINTGNDLDSREQTQLDAGGFNISNVPPLGKTPRLTRRSTRPRPLMRDWVCLERRALHARVFRRNSSSNISSL